MAARRRAHTGASFNIVRTFPSLSAMVEASQRPTDFGGERSSRRPDDAQGWFGSATFGEAVQLVHRWNEGAKDIDTMRAEMVKGAAKVITRTVRRPVPPGRVDVAGVAARNPNAGFIARKRTTRTKAGSKVVRVLVNVSASSQVSPEAIKRRGAAILALVDMLQERGLRVEILATCPNAESGMLDYRWTVKDANANTSLGALAFGLAHPSMLRRIVFSLMECEDDEVRRAFGVYGGYGCVSESPMGAVVAAEGGIYLPMMRTDGQWASNETAREWVRAEVERVMG